MVEGKRGRGECNVHCLVSDNQQNDGEGSWLSGTNTTAALERIK